MRIITQLSMLIVSPKLEIHMHKAPYWTVEFFGASWKRKTIPRNER